MASTPLDKFAISLVSGVLFAGLALFSYFLPIVVDRQPQLEVEEVILTRRPQPLLLLDSPRSPDDNDSQVSGESTESEEKADLLEENVENVQPPSVVEEIIVVQKPLTPAQKLRQRLPAVNIGSSSPENFAKQQGFKTPRFLSGGNANE